DVDLEAIVPILMRGIFQNCGQNCIGIEKIVHEHVYDKLIEMVSDRVSKLIQGPSLSYGVEDPSVMMGDVAADSPSTKEPQVIHETPEIRTELETGTGTTADATTATIAEAQSTLKNLGNSSKTADMDAEQGINQSGAGPFQGDGAVPSQHLLSQLQREESVENIVNMCGEFQGHLETMAQLGLVQCWIPTPDFHVPTLESIWVGVHFISKCEARWQELEESKRGHVYIHCKVYYYNLTPQEAQGIMLKSRPQASLHEMVDKNIYLHPEVILFYEQVQEQEGNGAITRRSWPGTL
ncbi:Meiotic Sister-Chromatid recombination aldehyde dehydrogenase, partial [Mortierella sp. GBA43]